MNPRQRILIFQIGSLGDTVIAMPCYREIARRHPEAERLLLTNFPIGQKMVPAEAMLAPAGLVAGSVQYPMPLRGYKNIVGLRARLRALKVDILYYLTPEKRLVNLLRHYTFFKTCGIASIRAMPWTRDKRFPREFEPASLWESEGSRLLRNVEPARAPGPPPPADRLLDLTALEHHAADELLTKLPGAATFIVASVGGKVPINDWGDDNWVAVLQALSASTPELGCVFIGSHDERERNERLASSWTGPRLNSCGRLTPRETAALIQRAALFLGHDTGTLHLSAAVATPIIGIYSARNVPGKWYSDRPGDTFFYNKPPCFGCEIELPQACPHSLICMTSHSREAIIHAAQLALTPAYRDRDAHA